MANQITDNRTSLFVAQISAPASETWEASGGGGSIVEDVDIFIQGTTSVTEQISSSRRVMLFDNGSTQDLSNGHVYIWVNCGIVGILDTKANGGMTVRLTGPTSTNFVEWYVGGSDSWPTSIQGGWTMFVVDTASTPSNTGGTPPALTAIQKIGISAITNGTMTKAADNTWVDAAWFLGDGNPGIIVEGRNGGTTDWDFADINTQLGNAAGMFIPGEGGSWVCNAPIQFGINDTTTHGFTDTNQTILWSNQEFAASDLYKLSALGNSGGTTNVTLGVKTGTGDDATGAQGCVIQAASTGVRWDMDFDDPDVDGVNLYGCTLIHGGTFQLDDPAVSVISTQYIDCSSAIVSNSEQLKVSVINANTADGVAFMTTDDLGDIVRSSFQFSDGHAIELTTPRVATQTSKGNKFIGYGSTGTNDAAVYNNTAGAVTISVTDTGDSPTYRNGTSASTSVTNAVPVVVTVKDAADQSNIQNARVYLEADTGGDLPAGDSVSITRSGSTATVTHTAHGLTTGNKVKIRGANETEYNLKATITVTGANDYTYTVSGTPATPATGTITSTSVILDDLSNASGIVQDTGFPFTATQPVKGNVRRGTSAPLYKTGILSGSIVTGTGFSQTVFLVSDE